MSSLAGIFASILSYAWFCWLINASFNFFYELAGRIGFFAYRKPFDLGMRFFDGNRILGDSTTLGSLGIAVAFGWTLDMLYPGGYFLLKAMTTYFGHAAGSFIKRRLGVRRGDYLPVVDHGNYMILTGAVFYALGLESAFVVIAAVAITLLFHPIVCYLTYRAGWRERAL